MANSIDWSAIALGAVVGIGCRKQIKSAAKIAVGTAATLACACADAAADAANAVAQSAKDNQGGNNDN